MLDKLAVVPTNECDELHCVSVPIEKLLSETGGVVVLSLPHAVIIIKKAGVSHFSVFILIPV